MSFDLRSPVINRTSSPIPFKLFKSSEFTYPDEADSDADSDSETDEDDNDADDDDDSGGHVLLCPSFA